MKILVVDDDQFILEMITRMLSDQDFELTKRSNVDDAVAILETGENFDLVITDIVMPGKDGTKLARYIKQNIEDVPVLAITAGVENAATDYMYFASMFADESMVKPLHKDQLVETIKRLTVH